MPHTPTYVYDFEAEVLRGKLTDPGIRDQEVRVYAAFIKSVDTGEEKCFLGPTAMDEFLKYVLDRPYSNYIAHNQDGYDGHFILYRLLEKGFEQTDDSINPETGEAYAPQKLIGKKNWEQFDRLKRFNGDTRAFTLLHQGKMYNFFDSMQLLSVSIKFLGDLIGKEQKGDETPLVLAGSTITDTRHRCVHEKNNPLWYKNPCSTCAKPYWTWGELIEYGLSDVRVLAEAVQEFNIPLLIENGIFTASKWAYEECWTEGRLRTADWLKGIFCGTHPMHWVSKLERKAFRPFYPPAQRIKVVKGKRKTEPHDKAMPTFWSARLMKDSKFAAEEKGLLLINDPMQKGKKLKHDNKLKVASRLAFHSYRGGFNYINPSWKNVTIKQGMTVLDITSLYPWIYSTIPIVDSVQIIKLVDSKTIQVDGEELTGDDAIRWIGDNLTIVRFIKYTAHIKDDYPPVIKAKTTNSGSAKHKQIQDDTKRERFNTDYMRQVNDMPHVSLTGYEVDYLLEAAEKFEWELGAVMLFHKSEVLSTLFKNHCRYWITVKDRASVECNEPLRYIAKLMLNSVYGKLGQYLKSEKKRRYRLDSFNTEGDENVDLGSDTAYTPAASMITAYGRVFMARAIHKVGIDKFVYCDTDSLHILGIYTYEELAELGLPVGGALGTFKIEGYTHHSRYIQNKTYGYALYIYEGKPTTSTENIGDEWKWKSVVAGFTEQIPESQFHEHISVVNLKSVNVRGGVALLETPYTVGENKPGNRGYRLNHLDETLDYSHKLHDETIMRGSRLRAAREKARSTIVI